VSIYESYIHMAGLQERKRKTRLGERRGEPYSACGLGIRPNHDYFAYGANGNAVETANRS